MNELRELTINQLLAMYREFVKCDHYDPCGTAEEDLERDYPGITKDQVFQEILKRTK